MARAVETRVSHTMGDPSEESLVRDSGSPRLVGQANHSVYSEAAELMRRIRASEGERVFWRMEALAATLFVFGENRLGLVKRLTQVEAPGNRAQFFSMRKRETLRLFQMDIMRLMHNFLASAFTLKEHSNVLARELLSGQSLNREYQQEVAELFADSALAGLVQGLRNWMLHKGLLPVVVRLSATGENGEPVSSVVLRIDALKSWDGWNSRARQHLANLTSDPRLCDLVDSYSGLVQQFHCWLERRLLEVHTTALLESHELGSRFRAIYGVPDQR